MTLLVKYGSSIIILTINFDDPDENCFAMVPYDATYIWGSRAQLREGFPMAAHMNGRGLALRVGGCRHRNKNYTAQVVVLLSFNFYPSEALSYKYNYYPR